MMKSMSDVQLVKIMSNGNFEKKMKWVVENLHKSANEDVDEGCKMLSTMSLIYLIERMDRCYDTKTIEIDIFKNLEKKYLKYKSPNVEFKF